MPTIPFTVTYAGAFTVTYAGAFTLANARTKSGEHCLHCTQLRLPMCLPTPHSLTVWLCDKGLGPGCLSERMLS
jgi:hypothetical protein